MLELCAVLCLMLTQHELSARHKQLISKNHLGLFTARGAAGIHLTLSLRRLNVTEKKGGTKEMLLNK